MISNKINKIEKTSQILFSILIFCTKIILKGVNLTQNRIKINLLNLIIKSKF